VKFLHRRFLWMTVGEWMASLAAGQIGGWGWWLVFNNLPWEGAAVIAIAQIMYCWLMGYDLEERR